MPDPRKPTQFTYESAERIARVVRAAETGPPAARPLSFETFRESKPMPPLKVATFTGAWSTGSWKTVTIVGSTATAAVYNWCNASTGSAADTRYVVFGKANGTNSVVEIQMESTASTCSMSIAGKDLTGLAGYSAGSIQLLGHNTTGHCLQWYSVTTCSTSTAA